MKKLFLMIAAVAALFATSCVQDVSADLNLGEPGVVTFAVETPQLASRAYGNADEATQLYYAVYRDGELLTAISKTKEPVELEADGKTDVSLSLASGLTYDLVFWAASPDAINGKLYSIDWANKSMKLTSNKLVASDESLDAFYYYVEPFKVEGTTAISVTLRRPFAQINVATADYELAKSAGLAVAESWFEVLGAYTNGTYTITHAAGNIDGNYVGSWAGTGKSTTALSFLDGALILADATVSGDNITASTAVAPKSFVIIPGTPALDIAITVETLLNDTKIYSKDYTLKVNQSVEGSVAKTFEKNTHYNFVVALEGGKPIDFTIGSVGEFGTPAGGDVTIQ